MAEEKILHLSGIQRTQLIEAFISAFRTETKLKMMLLEEMNVRLNTVAGGTNYRETVFELIDWAEGEGELAKLINAAHRRNSGNPDLKQFINSFGIIPAASVQAPFVAVGPDFIWRGPDADQELQGFWQPEPELWDVNFLNRGIRQAAAVCLIELPGKGAIGTGFLIKQDLLLTNYHVIAPTADADPGAFLQEIVLRFNHLTPVKDEAQTQELKLVDNPILATSPTHELDFVLLRVENKIHQMQNIVPVDFDANQLPTAHTGIHILQHPTGQAMKLALSSNGITGVFEQDGVLQYVSRTARGSSGSPCFNDAWEVVALHHAQVAKPFGVICEGILLKTIYPKISAFL